MESIVASSSGSSALPCAHGDSGVAAKEDNARFRDLILSMPVALYTTDCEGRITLFNEPAVALWGRRPEIGVDMWCGSWRIFNSDGSPCPLDQCPMAMALHEEKPVLGREIIVEKPDGTRSCVLPHPQPLRDAAGKMIGAVNMLVDITGRKKSEEQIQELNRSLEARVVDRTAQLEAFCFSIAHDMRQHIRGVSLNAHMVSDLIKDLDPDVRATLNRLVSSAKHMDRLVTDLLTYARMAKHEVRHEVIDFSQLASEVAAQLMAIYPDAEFRIQPDMKVDGDPSSLGVVLQNLMDNACKYAAPDRKPVIEIGSVDGAFHVRDNGSGFEMKYASQLFQPFQRLHRHSDVPGTGIGLASVKQIIEKHGGKVWADSKPNQGATFFFELI